MSTKNKPPRLNQQFLESGDYLPEFLKDFHDQKHFFKSMHSAYRENDPKGEMPNWIQGHCYTIDWFLWYVARRGYTLQKSRANVEFEPLP